MILKRPSEKIGRNLILNLGANIFYLFHIWLMAFATGRSGTVR